MCLVKCHFIFFFALNIALHHQMKALMNEKCHHWDVKVQKDGLKMVMEDIFFNQMRKKTIVKVTRILPGKKRTQRKRKSMQAKHKL